MDPHQPFSVFKCCTMLKRIHYRRSGLVLSGIIVCALVFVKCVDPAKDHPGPTAQAEYSQYAGSRTCAGCHKNIYESHIHTPHYLTSQKSTESNIRGSFLDGKNKFMYDQDVYVVAEKRPDGLFQVEYVNGTEKISRPIDITIGSGKIGQTFLYWDRNRLFQLPLTYFTPLDQWTNSPGFSNRVVYRRPITSRCLECHGTYFQKLSDEKTEPEDFSKENIIYGVDCEKCHGPAARHADFHEKNPGEKKGQYIIDPKGFTRQQSLDMCRLCHGGRLAKTRPSFTFRAGDSLANFFAIHSTAPPPGATIDAHGNQYGMLASSKCFAKSQMTCGTCHSPHENETTKLELFSQRCMSCHNTTHNNFCKIVDRTGYDITKNCIDCHMPEMASKSIMVLLQGETVPAAASMRSHLITVYPEETKKFLAIKKKK